MNRRLLYRTNDKDAPTLVFKELDRLEGLYLAAKKRKVPFDISISDWNEAGKRNLGLTAYYETKHQADLDFLIQHIL